MARGLDEVPPPLRRGDRSARMPATGTTTESNEQRRTLFKCIMITSSILFGMAVFSYKITKAVLTFLNVDIFGRLQPPSQKSRPCLQRYCTRWFQGPTAGSAPLATSAVHQVSTSDFSKTHESLSKQSH